MIHIMTICTLCSTSILPLHAISNLGIHPTCSTIQQGNYVSITLFQDSESFTWSHFVVHKIVYSVSKMCKSDCSYFLKQKHVLGS